MGDSLGRFKMAFIRRICPPPCCRSGIPPAWIVPRNRLIAEIRGVYAGERSKEGAALEDFLRLTVCYSIARRGGERVREATPDIFFDLLVLREFSARRNFLLTRETSQIAME